MKKVIFDPDFFIISEQELYDDDKRDKFIIHLEDGLKAVANYDFISVYWNDEFDNFLFSGPYLLDNKNQYWFNYVIPKLCVLHGRYLPPKNITSIEPKENLGGCINSPPLNYGYSEEIYDFFLTLLHTLIDRQEDVFLCLGLANANSKKEMLSTCSCHDYTLKTTLIHTHNDWLFHINIEDVYWPLSHSEKEMVKFELALHLFAKKELNNYGKEGFLYSYEFKKRFFKAVLKESTQRRELLFGISKRLLLNQKEASSDTGLKDEPVRGKPGTRRFRITIENRVQYSYGSDGSICFLDYFSKGEHDDGL